MEAVTRLFLVRPPAGAAPDGPIDGTLDLAADGARLDSMAPLLERLARRRPAAIVGSPSERSLRVVRELALRCGAAGRVEADLRPRFLGAWQGARPATLGARWGSFLADRAGAGPADAEPLAEAESRVLAVLDRLAAEHPGRELVVVAHADGLRAALARALDSAHTVAFAPEPGQAVALDWAHPEAREFRHAVIGVAFDWDVAPPSNQVHRFPGGASVLPRPS